MRNPGREQNSQTHHVAFTLLELLVVIAIIAILAAILFPVLDKAKQKALGLQCLNNLHQIAMGFHMYCDDNHGFFPINLSGSDSDQTENWVAGRMDDSSQNTNSAVLIDSRYSQLAVDVRNPALYKCPSDRSTQLPLLQGPPRVRSYALSGAIGCGDLTGTARTAGDLQTYPPAPPATQWLVYAKENQMSGGLGPADIYTFVDEHPDSIDDGVFGNVMTSSDTSTWVWWQDVPAKWHNNACPFIFADGHSEMHRWPNPGLIPNVTYQYNLYNGSDTTDPDVQWVSAHATIPAP